MGKTFWEKLTGRGGGSGPTAGPAPVAQPGGGAVTQPGAPVVQPGGAAPAPGATPTASATPTGFRTYARKAGSAVKATASGTAGGVKHAFLDAKTAGVAGAKTAYSNAKAASAQVKTDAAGRAPTAQSATGAGRVWNSVRTGAQTANTNVRAFTKGVVKGAQGAGSGVSSAFGAAKSAMDTANSATEKHRTEAVSAISGGLSSGAKTVKTATTSAATSAWKGAKSGVVATDKFVQSIPWRMYGRGAHQGPGDAASIFQQERTVVANNVPEPLSKSEQNQLKRAKKDPALTVAEKAATLGEPREEVYNADGTRIDPKKRHTVSGIQDGLGILDEVGLGTGGAVTDIIGASKSAASKKSLGTSFADVFKEGGAEELPYVGGILSAISAAVKLGSLIIDVVKNIKDKNKSKHDWLDVALQGVEVGMDSLNAGFSIASDAGQFFARLPVMGVILGAISGAMQMGMSGYHFIRANISFRDMKRQMGGDGRQKSTKAKDASGDNIEIDDELTKRRWYHRRAVPMKRHKRVDDVNAEQEAIIARRVRLLAGPPTEPVEPDPVPALPAGATDAEKETHREKTEEFNQKKAEYDVAKTKYDAEKADYDGSSAEREQMHKEEDAGGDKTVESLRNKLEVSKQQDMMYEIRKANKNRMRRTGMEIVQGFVKIISSLAALDPTYGAAAGTGVQLLSDAAGWGVKGTGFARQKSRNLGFIGADTSKSSRGKKQRRHRLAVTMFRDLKRVGGYGLRGQDEAASYTSENKAALLTKMDRYKTVSDRLYGMGVGMSNLKRENDADDMVQALRKGFYRDSR